MKLTFKFVKKKKKGGGEGHWKGGRGGYWKYDKYLIYMYMTIYLLSLYIDSVLIESRSEYFGPLILQCS